MQIKKCLSCSNCKSCELLLSKKDSEGIKTINNINYKDCKGCHKYKFSLKQLWYNSSNIHRENQIAKLMSKIIYTKTNEYHKIIWFEDGIRVETFLLTKENGKEYKIGYIEDLNNKKNRYFYFSFEIENECGYRSSMPKKYCKYFTAANVRPFYTERENV